MTNVTALRGTQPYEYHPFSDIWPLLEGPAFEELATDIAANGLLVPIVLYQDKILDGRNRDRACIEAGVEPRYEQANAADDAAALELVMSLNQHRRHLSFQERAFAAARYANIQNGSNQHYPKGTSRDVPSRKKNISIDEAAAKFEISTASVDRARRVIKHGDEKLEQDVKRGKVHLRIAAERVTPKKKGVRPAQTRGLPVSARVPMIDTSKRRVLTPQEVDPEFTGTSNEFTTKYGHVQIETAEERAANRFREWNQHIRKWAREYREFPLSAIDLNWLRSPRGKDVDQFLEAYATLALVFDNIQSIRDKAKALKKGED